MKTHIFSNFVIEKQILYKVGSFIFAELLLLSSYILIRPQNFAMSVDLTYVVPVKSTVEILKILRI